MTEQAKTRKPKIEIPYVVGVWADGKFVPCDAQPETPITQFDEIVKWAVEKFGSHPDKYNFVRRDPRTLTIEERKSTRGVVA